jgi:hypothetical protein
VSARSPVQLNALAKAIALIFFGLCIIWAAVNYVLVREVYLHWLVLTVNGLLAFVVGWLVYRRTRHTTFSYGRDGFEMEIGTRRVAGLWRDYTGVSLRHLGHGTFSVRLYKDGDVRVEIPASALKLNPSAFRFEVMSLVEGKP